MVDITKHIDGTLTFSYDGGTLPYVFVKVKQVAENSNYYCLWITKEEFHLFNIKTKEYAFKINTYKESKTFSRIEYYSYETKSFVAYKSNTKFAYLLFEDGDYENHVFKYIGKEFNGIRAVKGQNDRWVYYNVLKKGFTFNIKKGLLLRDGEELVPLFNLKYYTILNSDLYYRLILFDSKKHKTYHSDKIEYFEDTEDNCVIAKLYNKNVFALFKRTNLITPIGYFNSKPRYVETRNIFIAKKLNSYVLIYKNNEISNCQWTEDFFIFHDNYILTKSGTRLKLYSFNDGKEICTNWTNIRYDSEFCRIVADTDKQKNQIITIDDIQNMSNLLIEKPKRCFNHTEQHFIQQEKSTGIACVKHQNKDKKTTPDISQYNELPSCIDFIIYDKHIEISPEGYIIPGRVNKMLSANNYICWIIQDKQIIITRYTKSKAHKIVYYKDNIASHIFEKPIQIKKFIKINLQITAGEDSLLEGLSTYYYKYSNLPEKERSTASKPILKLDIDSVKELSKCVKECVEDNISPYNLSRTLAKSPKLPFTIDMCVFVKDVYILDGMYIQEERNKKNIQKNSKICWIVSKGKEIFVTKYRGYFQALSAYIYEILYRTKDFADNFLFDNESEYTYTAPFRVCTMDDLINRLKEITVKDRIKNKPEVFTTKKLNVKRDELLILVPYHINKSLIKSVSSFIFDDISYTLKIDDIWNNTTVFTRRQFILKKSIIAILLDSSSQKFVENNITYYEIIGEGKDKRFNQDFNGTNGSIRDNTRRIILFRKGFNGDILFENEVVCIGFREVLDYYKTSSRKIIIFKLRSLLKNT